MHANTNTNPAPFSASRLNAYSLRHTHTVKSCLEYAIGNTSLKIPPSSIQPTAEVTAMLEVEPPLRK